MNQNEIQQQVCQLIEDEREEIVKTLQTLVQIPTQTGQETDGQKYMHSLYSKLGLKVVSLEADREKARQHKAFVNSGWDFKGRPNIIGILEGEPSARSLVLNGHIDVVSPEPTAEWDFPPWGGKVVGNKLYGRGACDMKAGLIANYCALKTVLAAGLKPKGTVILHSVIEEEPLGGGGTLACLMKGFTADGLVVSEPNMKIILAHPGLLFFRVKVTGKSAHAGAAHTGVNAIGKMNKVYQALVELDALLAGDPNFVLALWTKAAILARRGDVTEALPLLHRALELASPATAGPGVTSRVPGDPVVKLTSEVKSVSSPSGFASTNHAAAAAVINPAVSATSQERRMTKRRCARSSRSIKSLLRRG